MTVFNLELQSMTEQLGFLQKQLKLPHKTSPGVNGSFSFCLNLWISRQEAILQRWRVQVSAVGII